MRGLPSNAMYRVRYCAKRETFSSQHSRKLFDTVRWLAFFHRGLRSHRLRAFSGEEVAAISADNYKAFDIEAMAGKYKSVKIQGHQFRESSFGLVRFDTDNKAAVEETERPSELRQQKKSDVDTEIPPKACDFFGIDSYLEQTTLGKSPSVGTSKPDMDTRTKQRRGERSQAEHRKVPAPVENNSSNDFSTSQIDLSLPKSITSGEVGSSLQSGFKRSSAYERSSSQRQRDVRTDNEHRGGQPWPDVMEEPQRHRQKVRTPENSQSHWLSVGTAVTVDGSTGVGIAVARVNRPTANAVKDRQDGTRRMDGMVEPRNTSGRVGVEHNPQNRRVAGVARESRGSLRGSDRVSEPRGRGQEPGVAGYPRSSREGVSMAANLRGNALNTDSAEDNWQTSFGEHPPVQKNETGGDPEKSALLNTGLASLKALVKDWDMEPSSAVVHALKAAVVFSSGELLAINKPYGIASHGGPLIHHSIAGHLQQLASVLRHDGDLHLVHRLDKETTGVLLLARTQQTAVTLQRMFQQREVLKKYWALTRGIPDPAEGVIDIPLAESLCDGQYRMALRPNDSSREGESKGCRHSKAVTKYRILSQSGSCALVEVEPLSGVKHQIRTHLSFALDATILGDHKFSHRNKIAPQRLFPDILHRLHISQSKVRYVPMHLHAYSLILPEFDSGRNVFITAPLPRHFQHCMKLLKLSSNSAHH